MYFTPSYPVFSNPSEVSPSSTTAFPDGQEYTEAGSPERRCVLPAPVAPYKGFNHLVYSSDSDSMDVKATQEHSAAGDQQSAIDSDEDDSDDAKLYEQATCPSEWGQVAIQVQRLSF